MSFTLNPTIIKYSLKYSQYKMLQSMRLYFSNIQYIHKNSYDGVLFKWEEVDLKLVWISSIRIAGRPVSTRDRRPVSASSVRRVKMCVHMCAWACMHTRMHLLVVTKSAESLELQTVHWTLMLRTKLGSLKEQVFSSTEPSLQPLYTMFLHWFWE